MRLVKQPPLPLVKKKLPPPPSQSSTTNNSPGINISTSCNSSVPNENVVTVSAGSSNTEKVPMIQETSRHPVNETKRTNNLSLEDAVTWVVPLLAKFFSRNHLELEVRLGKVKDGKFASCITREDFNTFHDMLMSYRGWSNIQEVDAWVSTFDYLLDNDIRCTKSSRGNAFIRKTLMDNLTFQCRGRRYDIRFSLKEEVPVEMRTPGIPHLVRVKKRKSFVYCGKYSFDLTVVWSGKDEQEAQNNDPIYEIELECVNKEIMGTDHRYNATSLLEKMIDFLGREGQISFDVVGETSRK